MISGCEVPHGLTRRLRAAARLAWRVDVNRTAGAMAVYNNTIGRVVVFKKLINIDKSKLDGYHLVFFAGCWRRIMHSAAFVF